MSLWQMIIVLLFGYPLPPEMVDPRFPVFMQRSAGLWLTLLITTLSLAIGAVIGTALAVCRRESAQGTRGEALDPLIPRALHHADVALVEGVRGLPIMLLVLLAFHLPYRLLRLRFPAFVLAIAAFSLYAGIYLSEIIRAGFRCVDPELRYAGRVLGLTRRQILLRIDLPLTCRNMAPDLINLAVTVFKDTSTLAVVAVPELTYVGRQMLMSEPMNYALALLLVLAFYWLPASILSVFAVRAERRRPAPGASGHLL